MKTTSIIFVFCLATTIQTAVADDKSKASGIRFNEQIRPILSEYCAACHGPDKASRKADLRLDVREIAIESGAITPGNAEDSELVARINSDDAEFVMPPPSFRKKLTAQQKKLIASWIDAGAKFEKHWAFIKSLRTDLPMPDGVEAWALNPIDHFVLEKLRKLGLKPNGLQDRHTLARRAALDITGIPPTPKELDAFLRDTNEQPYDRYVKELLASKHAGEHRARYWLDAARYGDTHGMHVDNYREIWPYRDWVIRAFNANMPFDQFVVEQIAGDLLPDATLDQRIATGFNRCNITTSEGGAIPAELDVRYMVDRVETMATVFLGLTAGCAVCHNHKYDPISQREFYQFGAFFNNTTQPAMDGNQKDTPPVVVLPDTQFEGEWAALRRWRSDLRSKLSQWTSRVENWWPSHPRQIDHPVSNDMLVLWLPLTEGGSVELPDSARWAENHPSGRRGIRFGKGGELTVDLPALRSDEPLTISFWFRTPDRVMATTIFGQTKKTDDKKTVGWQITSNTQGNLSFQLFDASGKSVHGILPDNEALRPRSWQHVCVRYSGGQSNSSISILVNGRAAPLRNSSEAYIDASALTDVPLKIGSNLSTSGLSDVRIFRRWVSDEETRLLARDVELKKLLAADVAWNTLKQKDHELLTRFYNQAMDADFQLRARELSQTQLRRDFIYARSTTTLVMQERPESPRAWVLQRGEYDQRGDEVGPGVPAILDFGRTASPGRPANRLDLAKWLVNPDHPLTARVMVNRLWQSVFGIGLVKTSEDFGVMGDRPTHPELLDWLSVEFVESGWDVKHIVELMVTSATYRQSNLVTPNKLEKDPDNRFLARGPRLRLDAEVLRDQVLAVSGLLKRNIGGASVKPYQPTGLWNVVAITSSNTSVFKRDSGDALYRRSLYTFWKRTSPPPTMAAFNAPTREQCTVRRERTNTPLQALVLMNDPQFVEAARHLAERALDRQKNDRSRAKWMLETVLIRPAQNAEVMGLAITAAEFLAIFKLQPETAKMLIKTGDSKPDEKLDVLDLAAWTMVANTLMNRDDFINK
jgi:hypothetical protein